jgi:SAM-dependent methyltransferase
MSDYERAVCQLYGQAELGAKILAALREAGKDLDALTQDDLGSFDELHDCERASTSKLARLVEIRDGTDVLDVGSGLGGPARRLASEYDCRVAGLDVTAEFCRAATALTALVGLYDRVVFHHGSAFDLPFEDASFDVVWTQGVLMNLRDKPKFFAEAARVLRPGGRLAFQASLAGAVEDVHYPTLWADDAQLSFLPSPAECRTQLAAAGFRQRVWRDITADAVVESRTAQRAGSESASIRSIIAPDRMGERLANRLRNYVEGHVVQVMAVYELAPTPNTEPRASSEPVRSPPPAPTAGSQAARAARVMARAGRLRLTAQRGQLTPAGCRLLVGQLADAADAAVTCNDRSPDRRCRNRRTCRRPVTALRAGAWDEQRVVSWATRDARKARRM